MKELLVARRYRNTTVTHLVQRCLHGDEDAWSEMVERYARLVHAIPARNGLPPTEVDDVGQEVFLALAQHLHEIEDPERLPAWLVTTARRATWRALQRRRQEEPVDLTEDEREDSRPSSTLGKPIPTPEQLLAGWQTQEALQRAMERLGPRCRKLLTLLFLDINEPGYDEISRQLDMPKGSIGPTRNRCLQQLRAFLVDLEGNDES